MFPLQLVIEIKQIVIFHWQRMWMQSLNRLVCTNMLYSPYTFWRRIPAQTKNWSDHFPLTLQWPSKWFLSTQKGKCFRGLFLIVCCTDVINTSMACDIEHNHGCPVYVETRLAIFVNKDILEFNKFQLVKSRIPGLWDLKMKQYNKRLCLFRSTSKLWVSM